MSKKTPLTLVAIIMLLGSTSAAAQSANDAVMTPEELQLAKQMVEASRDMALVTNIDFTPQEAEDFWPLYEEYRQKVRAVRERKLDLIEAYADRYRAGMVDDAFADKAIRDGLQVQIDTAKVRQKYWKKFRRILSATKAARFYQLESKMDAEVDFVLAGGVPLVETD